MIPADPGRNEVVNGGQSLKLVIKGRGNWSEWSLRGRAIKRGVVNERTSLNQFCQKGQVMLSMRRGKNNKRDHI